MPSGHSCHTVQVSGDLTGVNPIILTMDGETPGQGEEDGAGAQWLFKDQKLYCAYNDGMLGFESSLFSRSKPLRFGGIKREFLGPFIPAWQPEKRSNTNRCRQPLICHWWYQNHIDSYIHVNVCCFLIFGMYQGPVVSLKLSWMTSIWSISQWALCGWAPPLPPSTTTGSTAWPLPRRSDPPTPSKPESRGIHISRHWMGTTTSCSIKAGCSARAGRGRACRIRCSISWVRHEGE